VKKSAQTTLRIVSQYYYPDVANTGQLLYELSQGLVRSGIQTEVITARPSYDNTIDAVRRENLNGISIRRIPATRWNKNTRVGKIINAVTFFCSSVVALLMSDSKAPLLIVSNPPFLPLVGVLLRWLRGVDYIFLVHDIYPDIAVHLGYLSPHGLTQKLWHWLNRWILGNASGIIVLSESMRLRIESKLKQPYHGKSRPGVFVIPNWADGDYIVPQNPDANPFICRHGLENRFIVQYSGNMGLFHDLECVVEAARLVRDEEFLFLFIGGGGKKMKLEQMAQEYALTNVRFLPYQDRSVLPDSLTAAHCAVVTLEKGIEGLAMPSKLATILAAGIPVVAFCDENSDIAAIIREGKCGYDLRQGDSTGLVRIITELRQNPALRKDMGQKSRLWYETNFTFERALQEYRRIIHDLGTSSSMDRQHP
jgi:glycosyltransferase involved in cell wall biosynthesis